MRFLSRPRNSPRPRSRGPSRARRLGLWFAGASLAAAALTAAGVSAYLWKSGALHQAYEDAADALLAESARLGLAVGTVLVEGRNRTAADAVLAALDVRRGLPLLAFDPEAAKDRLERLAWVRAAGVERRFPGTILVRLAERRPLALWQQGGILALVDDTGAVITRERIERFGDLPIVVGADAPKQAPALLAMLESEPELNARVTAAVRVSGRRWDVRLDDEIDVRLPEENADTAWRRLADMNRTYGLLSRGVIVIDLRMEDRLVLKLSPSAVRRLREPGADT